MDSLITGFIIFIISIFIMRLVFSIEKFIKIHTHNTRLLIGIAKRLNVEQKYLPKWNEFSDAYPDKPTS